MFSEAIADTNYAHSPSTVINISNNPDYASGEAAVSDHVKYIIAEQNKGNTAKFRDKVENIVSKLDNIDVSKDSGFIEEHKLLCQNLISDAQTGSKEFDKAYAELQREFYDRIYAIKYISAQKELEKLSHQTAKYGLAKQEIDEIIEGVMVKHYAKKEAAKGEYYTSDLAETADMGSFLSRLRTQNSSLAMQKY